MVILLLSLIQAGCQLQAKVCAQSTGKPLSLSLPRKNVVRSTDCLDMTIAVDWDIKPQTKQQKNTLFFGFLMLRLKYVLQM